MAGNGHGNGVRRAGLRHGAHGLGSTDAPGDLRVARGRARRDFAQRTPDAFLERRSLHIQRQVQADRWRFDQPHHLGDPVFEFTVAPDDLGLGELVLQVAHQPLGVIAQQDRADAALALGHQYGAQRALAHREADDGAGTACPVVARAHAQQIVSGFIEPAVGIEARAIDGIGDRGLRAAQFPTQLAGAVGRAVRLGCQPGFGLEHAVEVERAHAHLLRQVIERRRRLRCLDHAAGARHQRGALGRGAGLVGAGAAAGAVTRGLGGFGAVEELDVLALGTARHRTRWAVHAGGAHGVDEMAVGGDVPRLHGGPAGVFGVVSKGRVHGRNSVSAGVIPLCGT